MDETLAPFDGMAVVDLRSEEKWEERSVLGSVSMPAEEISDRLYELPETGVELVLVGDGGECEGAAVERVREAGWTARYVIWDEVPREWTAGGVRGGYLWKPSPLLTTVINLIEDSLPPEGGWAAADVGCGHGRDMAYLYGRGWEVTGVDNRQPLLDHVKALAARLPAPPGTPLPKTVNADLKKPPFPLPMQAYDLVTVVRFLLRSTLPGIKASVKPGGYILYSHFVDGCQLISTPKSPNHYFQHGELADLFCADGEFEAVINEEANIPDGRPIVNFLARRVQN